MRRLCIIKKVTTKFTCSQTINNKFRQDLMQRAVIQECRQHFLIALQHWTSASGTRMIAVLQSQSWYAHQVISGMSNPSSPTALHCFNRDRGEDVSPADLCVFQTLVVLSNVAPEPGPVTARLSWLGASVSGHVTAQTMHRPCFHGNIVKPSGRLSSDLDKDERSKREGTLADVNARFTRLFSALYRTWLPADLRQLSPCIYACLGTHCLGISLHQFIIVI